MEKLVRGWEELGVVDTIYEEEHEYYSTTPSVSSTLSLPQTPLDFRVEAWSVATGDVTNVVIQVQESRFCLHKDPLSETSGYLKRHLNETSELTLSPPLNITAETFTLVADFCYGVQILMTPFNVVALRVAAELLEMTERDGDENLGQKAEAYFRRAISLSREYALIGFRSCLPLLPEAETTAALASRCIEALSSFDDVDDAIISCSDDVKTVEPEVFQILAEAVKRRLSGSHDILYKFIDLYLKEYGGKITEDQKAQLCNTVDCTTLSPPLLMHAVQNPEMPLRFVVQAMFVDQLNTRRVIASASSDNHRTRRRHHRPPKPAPLQATMDATSFRILSLEKELEEMKMLLHESVNQGSTPFPARSSSLRVSTPFPARSSGLRGTTPERARSLNFRGTTPDEARSSCFGGTTPDWARSLSFRGTTPERDRSLNFRGTTPERAGSSCFGGITPDRARSSSFRGSTPEPDRSSSFRGSTSEHLQDSCPELAQSMSFRDSAPELVPSSSYHGSTPELARSMSYRESAPELGRSLSFRGGTPESRTQKGSVGSLSSLSGFRHYPREEQIGISTSSQASSEGITPRSEKSLKSPGQMLISRLKSALGMKKDKIEVETGFGGRSYGQEGYGYGNGNVVGLKKNMPLHQRFY